MSDIEIWKNVPGYEGLYQVSNLGRVKSLERISYFGRGNKNIYKLTESIRKPRKNRGGYLYLNLSLNGKKRSFVVHNLVMLAFVGPKPTNKTTINHINFDKCDNRLINLEYLSSKDNIKHYIDSIDGRRGETHPSSKITEKDVLEIREKYATGNYFQKDLGREYGLSQGSIKNIVLRYTWSHIK